MKTRLAFVLGAAVCAALLGYGYYLQYAQGLEPCPLCMIQRAFFYVVMALFIIAALHGPKRVGTTVYATLVVLFALGGAATATRQVWLQHLPPDKVPHCRRPYRRRSYRRRAPRAANRWALRLRPDAASRK